MASNGMARRGVLTGVRTITGSKSSQGRSISRNQMMMGRNIRTLHHHQSANHLALVLDGLILMLVFNLRLFSNHTHQGDGDSRHRHFDGDDNWMDNVEYMDRVLPLFTGTLFSGKVSFCQPFTISTEDAFHRKGHFLKDFLL